MAPTRLRPCRPTGAAVGTVALVLGAALLAASSGATWLWIVAALAAALVTAGTALGIAGAARARLVLLDAPRVAVAGEPARFTVAVRSPRAIAVRLVDGTAPVASWWQPGGEHRGVVVGSFAARGTVELLDVCLRGAAPFGLWPWERRGRVALATPTMVGPAPSAEGAPVLRAADELGDDERAVSRRGEAGALRGVREWSDGDPVSWVHWPSSARTGTLLVREWDPPTADELEVRVERTADPQAADTAARHAAGAVDVALRRAGRVRLDVPVPNGRHAAVVHDRLEAAALLAAADLPPAPRVTAAPATPSNVEGRWWPRLLVAAAIAIGAGASLVALRWPPTTTLVTLVGLPLATWVSWHHRRERSQLVVLFSALAVLVALLRFATGIDTTAAVGTVRDPLAELLIAIVVIHMADARERRNLRFALGSSAVLVFYAGALRVDPGYGLWALTWFAVAAGALAALHRSALADLGTLERDDPEPPRVAPRVARAVAVGVASVGVSVGLLALVPVPEGPVRVLSPTQVPVRSPIPTPGALAAPPGLVAAAGADGGDPSDADADPDRAGQQSVFGYTAFEPSFDTSTRGRPNPSVVMRVRAPAPDFWRGQTFEQWDGRTWTAADDPGELVDGRNTRITGFDGDPLVREGGEEFVQTYFLETDLPNLVFAAYRPTQLILDADVWVRPDGALRADTTLPDGSVYTVVSRRLPVTDEILAAQGAPGFGRFASAWQDPQMQRYLQLPELPDRLAQLAREITAPFPDVHGKVRAIEAWLGANVAYDLDAPVPPDGQDAVDHFVFEGRRGFCEQIASTLVVMLRAVGVPARVAAGYTPGERDPFAGVYVVRGDDAHAWAEVWYPLSGWQSYDPTASVPLAGDTQSRGSLGGPIAAAVGSLAVEALRWLVPAVLVGLTGWGVVALVRRRRRTVASPAWAAQARFERLARRAGVAVRSSDPNPVVAERLAAARPAAADAARAAAGALDTAAFGRTAPAAADDAEAAVATLARHL